MIYTDKFAFIHIPKTSGMSIKRAILNNCPNATLMPKETFGKTLSGPDWRVVMHYPYSYWEDIIKDKWIFSVVRNPFVRAASFYAYMKTSNAHRNRTAHLTFEDLFTAEKRTFLGKYYIPTLTQTEILTDSNGIMISNVFKMEDGYAELENKLGFSINEKENVTPEYNYLDYYDERREKFILELFEKDFENFNYRPSLT